MSGTMTSVRLKLHSCTRRLQTLCILEMLAGGGRWLFQNHALSDTWQLIVKYFHSQRYFQWSRRYSRETWDICHLECTAYSSITLSLLKDVYRAQGSDLSFPSKDASSKRGIAIVCIYIRLLVRLLSLSICLTTLSSHSQLFLLFCQVPKSQGELVAAEDFVCPSLT